METANRTKQHLSNALKALSKTMPLAKITIKDLCTFSNVNRGTFYYHFKDIHDLISWTYHTQITLPAREIMESFPITEMPSITGFVLNKVYKDREFYTQAIAMDVQNGLEETMLQDSLENWRILWNRAIEVDNFSHIYYENKDYLLEYFFRGHYYATMHWIREGMRSDPDELGRLLDSASLRGLVSIWQEIIETKETN